MCWWQKAGCEIPGQLIFLGPNRAFDSQVSCRRKVVLSINWDVAFVVHILVGIVAAFMYKEYEVDSHVDSVVL